MTFRFEELAVWKKSIELYDETNKITSGFPKDEMFGITNQMRRSALSVSLNIAEGSGRPTKKDFKMFLGYARGSLFETVSNLHVCERRGLISKTDYTVIYDECEVLSKMISALRNSL